MSHIFIHIEVRHFCIQWIEWISEKPIWGGIFALTYPSSANHWFSDFRKWVWKGYGVSFNRDLQKLPGRVPGQLPLDGRGWTGRPPEVWSNFNHSVSCENLLVNSSPHPHTAINSIKHECEVYLHIRSFVGPFEKLGRVLYSYKG